MNSNMQSAIPAAVLKANKTSKVLEVKPSSKLNIRRAIYNVIMDNQESGVYIEEMKAHMSMYGYSQSAVDSTMRSMLMEGILTRSMLKPYLYRVAKNCKPPKDDQVRVRVRRALTLAPEPVKDDNQSLPELAKLNNALCTLSSAVKGHSPTYYGNLETDIDLIQSHLSKLKKECGKASNMDAHISVEYHRMGLSLEQVIEKLSEIKETISTVQQLAKVIRNNPL